MSVYEQYLNTDEPTPLNTRFNLLKAAINSSDVFDEQQRAYLRDLVHEQHMTELEQEWFINSWGRTRG